MIALLVLLATIFALLGILFKTRVNYFKARNIPYRPFSLEDLHIFRHVHYKEVLQRAFNYGKHKSPVIGCFLGITPFFVVTNHAMARNVLIKDFSHFVNRGLYHNPKADPVGSTMLVINDDKWNALRSKMTPQFTSGKIKAMFPTILRFSDTLNKVMVEASKDPEWHLKSTLQKFSSDVIAYVGFGLDNQALHKVESDLLKYGNEAFRGVPDKSTLFGLFKMEFPVLCRFLGLPRYPFEVTRFFKTVICQTIKYRDENKVVIDDLMNAMIKLLRTEDGKGLTLNQVAGQGLSFLTGGYETTANSLNYMLYYLAREREIQQMLRDEIRSVLKKHENQVTYEALGDMPTVSKYMDEIFRVHPTSLDLTRQASRDYKVPDTDIVIRKGEWVLIPVKCLQTDPDVYEDPEKIVIDREDRTVLAFGKGPRACIAERFARVEVKLALVNLLKDHQILPTDRTPKQLGISRGIRLLTSNEKLYLKIEKMDD